MTGKLELGFPKATASNMREQAMRKILRNVRSQGHPYVELRDNGKKSIFFCTLCLKEFYSDDILFEHLSGKFHKQRLSTAKITLMGPNPWPFNDGLVFFDTSTENDKDLEIRDANQNRLLKFSDGDDNLAIVNFGEGVQSDVQPISADMLDDDCTLMIPNLLIGEDTFDVKASGVGWGKIAARFLEKDNVFTGIRRIWCEWLGKENNGQHDDVKVPEHDFALLIFPYDYSFGRSLPDDSKSLPPSASLRVTQSEGDIYRERKKSLSLPEDISDSLRHQYDSSPAESGLTQDKIENQPLRTSFATNKAARKELRRQKRSAAEKMCFMCQQKMLPGKDVAVLLNLKTRRLACVSRNKIGAFHAFHTSCLIHWILFCEFTIITNRLHLQSVRRGVKRKTVASDNKTGKRNYMEGDTPHIDCVFCPECQGTAMVTDEYPPFFLSEYPPFKVAEMFKLKMKAIDARRDWINSPEVLQNCSIGLHFPSQLEEIIQEKVEPIKLLRFYRVDDVPSVAQKSRDQLAPDSPR